MKTRKLTLVLATLFCTGSLVACTDANKKISFGDYWRTDSLSNGSATETLQYDVTFEKAGGLDLLDYTLAYGTGNYVTTLELKPDAYVYTTTLTVPVSFQFGENKAEFTDEVTTKVVFQNSGNGLRPVSSEKTVKSHTPVNATPTSLEGCYNAYDFTVKTEYPESNTGSSMVVYNPNDAEKRSESSSTFVYGESDYSHLDNEQLLLALRAVPVSTSTGSFSAYNPFLKTVQQVDFSFSTATTYTTSYQLNGEEKSSNISYRPVTLQLHGKNPGATQTAWISATDSPTNNAHRNMLLKLETPLAYSVGKLVYQLKSITTTGNI